MVEAVFLSSWVWSMGVRWQWTVAEILFIFYIYKNSASELLNRLRLRSFMDQFVRYIHAEVCSLSSVYYMRKISLKNIAYPISRYVATLTHYSSDISSDYI